jgi:flavin reductase (DIM6/NTAB) family NADH-FMN oxidoreductase RutF
MKTDDPKRSLGAALGRVPSGIFIVTVRKWGQETAMLASWLQQCSFEPPRVSLAVQAAREVVHLLSPEATIAINILEASQTDMIAHFGKGFPLGVDAFEGIEIVRDEDNAPILAEALAVLEGRLIERFPAGDHDLFIIEIHAGRVLDEGQPMIHIRKNGFHY